MKRAHTGFTIVELLIVIVVIGILAAITIVAYNGIQQRAQNTILTSDMANAIKAMKLSHAENGTYPTTLPSTLKLSKNVGMNLSDTGDANTFCINAQLNLSGAITRLYFDSANASPSPGVCSGSVISGSESGTIKPNLISSPEFSSGWSMGLSVAGQAMTTRPGASDDPYPTKPVLIWNNNVSRTTSWAIVVGGVNYSQILAGKTYELTYWVRKTGTGFTGTTNIFGVADGSNTNKAINTGATQTVNSTWTKVSGTSTAIANAISSNRTYLAVSTSPFPTTGWTLEFQGFEIVEQ